MSFSNALVASSPKMKGRSECDCGFKNYLLRSQDS